MDFRDYYATLGVAKTASAKDIKQAFRRLARKHHPDVNPGDRGSEAKFKELNEAYEVLGDPESRRKYDELGANWRQYEQAGAGGRRPLRGPAAGRPVPHHDARRDGEPLRRGRQSVLGLLQHLLRRPGPVGPARAGRRARPDAPAAARRTRDSARTRRDARRSRRTGDRAGRRRSAHARGAHPGRGHRRHEPQGRRRAPARAPAAPSALRAHGPRPAHARWPCR